MIYKYLLEIKYRFFFSLFAWIFVILNCYYFIVVLLYVFMRFSIKSNDTGLVYFLTTDVAEVFVAYAQLSYYIGNQMVLIFIYLQVFVFLSTGLYPFERSYFKAVMVITIVGWISCVLTINNLIFPTSWNFFLRFQEYLSFQNVIFYFEIKLNEYLKFYKSIYYLCTLLYQIIVLFFIFLDLFKTNLFIVKKLRKVFYLFFFIFSTFLTPPEVIYQLIISIFIIIMYELTIICVIFKNELIALNSATS